MKQVIKVKVITGGCEPSFANNGDWIDLRAAEDFKCEAPRGYRDLLKNRKLIPLGVAMELPEGMEAIVAPRSSTHKNFNILLCNSIGVIDHSYMGNNDQWMFAALPIGTVDIHKGDRICQFRIQLSQKATFKQKLKWLFSSGVELEFVDDLGNTDRGGIGSTGVK